MKALILVGGYGTRLRPLTLSVPKPLIHFCNKSIVEHQIAALVQAGVDHVILAVAYQPQTMLEALKNLEHQFNITITCSCEDQPLGTAGPIRLAEHYLRDSLDNNSESFFVLNSDVICEFPLISMREFHNKHGGEATILVTKVQNPSNFGVVVSDINGKVERFVEKPKEFVGDCINAGLYIIKQSAICRIKLQPTSIEKEIFPQMAAENVLYSYKLTGYWADIGQPKDFLSGMTLYLNCLAEKTKEDNECVQTNGFPIQHVKQNDERLSKGSHIIGNVLIHPSSILGAGCVIGPNVTIGAGCHIGEGVRLKNTAIMECVTLSSNSYISGSIIGWKTIIGHWVRIEGLTVVGEDVCIKDECLINQAFILPHKTITDHITEPGKIIM